MRELESSAVPLHQSEKAFSPGVYMLGRMPLAPTALQEALCDRLMLLQEASELSKGEFAGRVGLTGPQLTNIKNYRNPPSHDVIARAVHEFGLTTEWFYSESTVGIRDPKLAARLRALKGRSAA